jgi:pyruvate dehydrogenase E2 component (dihydrolipoamide acetyltransferase)
VAIELTMPKFGLTMHEGTIQRLFKTPGEAVRQGEPLYEVETEKVLYVVEAPSSGTLAAWVHGEGATVECGGLVAVIAESGDDPAAIGARYQASAADSNSASAQARPHAANGGAISSPPPAPPEGRRAASPIARKLATELGVDLATVQGSGPGGRITREDIERAAKSAKASAPSPIAPAAIINGAPAAAAVPMRGMRKTIAARMHQSLRDTAQLTISTEADVTAATEARERLKREFDFTYTDMIIHAAARALTRHPRMNSRLDGEVIALMPSSNIGMAVALDEGLIVPVIHQAERKSLREIASSTSDLGERARAGKLRIEDVSGGTFTVTNLGTWGVDAFTPILNIGETGILGVGRIVEKPAIYRGEVARRAMLTLSLTFDHRVIDGAPAAAFLQTVVDVLNYGDR